MTRSDAASETGSPVVVLSGGGGGAHVGRVRWCGTYSYDTASGCCGRSLKCGKGLERRGEGGRQGERARAEEANKAREGWTGTSPHHARAPIDNVPSPTQSQRFSGKGTGTRAGGETNPLLVARLPGLDC